jgi:hypothetical protein
MPHQTQTQRRTEAIQVKDAEATKVTRPADPAPSDLAMAPLQVTSPCQSQARRMESIFFRTHTGSLCTESQ